MDAAYDAKLIGQTSRELGHAPFRDQNGRDKEVIPVSHHEAVRDKIQSGAECSKSRLRGAFCKMIFSPRLCVMLKKLSSTY
jgi:hypothetical protein